MAASLRQCRTNRLATLALLLVAAAMGAGTAAAAERLVLDNGIRATIYRPSEILNAATYSSPGRYEIHTEQGALALTGDPASLTPYEFDHVVGALQAMHGLGQGVDVAVYLLPAVPAEVLGSFARQDAIYLAPGTGPIDPATAAYITTHEMGHVLTWTCLDPLPARWAAYRELRGLDLVSNGPAAVHANRAREILAEDIRFLFGGRLANQSNSIENHSLQLPDRVGGLRELLAGFFAAEAVSPVAATATAYPNPCNPLTTVSMAAGDFGDPAAARLRVYDLRGALVCTVRGATLANQRLSVQWDGTDDHGQAAPSGRYLYILQAGETLGRGAVTVVR